MESELQDINSDVIEVNDNHIESETKESSLKTTFRANPKEIMFGTFVLSGHWIEIGVDGIKVVDNAEDVNSDDIEIKLLIPFSEVNKILYTFEDSLITILIEIFESNKSRVLSLFANESDVQKRSFDPKAKDPRIKYIMFRFEDNCPQDLVKLLSDVGKRWTKVIITNLDNNYIMKTYEYTNDSIYCIRLEKEIEEKVKRIEETDKRTEEMDKRTEENNKTIEVLKKSEYFCPICLERKSQIEKKEKKIIAIDCGHVYCDSCLIGLKECHKCNAIIDHSLNLVLKFNYRKTQE